MSDGPQGWPPVDADVKAWVEAAVTDLVDALEAFGLIGIWLHGSLAQGSYRRPKSDVDLLVVVEETLNEEARRMLARRLVELSGARPTVGGLELSVVRLEDARAGRFPMPFEVHYGDEHAGDILAGTWDFASGRTDEDLAAHVRSVRERGVTLVGPLPTEVFAPVPDEVFRASVDRDLRWILEGDHVVESPFYGVLNLCRGLWLHLEAGPWTVPSKEEAGTWALDVVPPEQGAVVRAALEAYRDSRTVDAEERRRAGREWDAEALLAFRDWMAEALC